MKTLAQILLLSFLLTGCKEEAPAVEQFYDETTVSAVDPAIEAQRIQDSIKLRRELDDDRDKKRIICEKEISLFSQKAMSEISPSSGIHLAYNIIDATYDDVSRTYRTTFETSWDAYPAILDTERETHIFKGRMIVYGETNEMQLEEISINDAMRRGAVSMQGAKDLITLFDKMNNSQTQ